jgi:CBS domain-containing protein
MLVRRKLNGHSETASEPPRWPIVLAGIGLGSAAFYFLDPVVGRRRRALARDKAVRAAHLGRRDLLKVEHDVQNRARGLFARLRAALHGDDAPDEIIEARVRSTIGRVCSHSGAIDVAVTDGAVTLSGPVLRNEHSRVLRHVRHVRGVSNVDDLLEPHSRGDHIPELQDSRPPRFSSMRTPHCSEVMKRNVQTVREDDPIDRAAEKMALGNLGFLPVCDANRRVVGTLTDRDIVVRVIAKEMSPTACTVGEVMSTRVVSCQPDDELTLAEQFMAQNQVSRLVITDEDGTLEGVISLSDLAEREPPRRVARTVRAVTAREAQRPD